VAVGATAQQETGITLLGYRSLSLNSEVEILRFRANQCGVGFPACRCAGLSSPALGDWKVAQLAENVCLKGPGLTGQLRNSGLEV
jgi:hypothetical protein